MTTMEFGHEAEHDDRPLPAAVMTVRPWVFTVAAVLGSPETALAHHPSGQINLVLGVAIAAIGLTLGWTLSGLVNRWRRCFRSQRERHRP